jgi:hypothetical protein
MRGFSAEKTAVPSLNPNNKSRFIFLLFQYSTPVLEEKINSNLLFPQISLYRIADHTEDVPTI